MRPWYGSSISTSSWTTELRRVELAAALALGVGELAQEVFVDAAQDVLGAALRVAQADGADEVDQLAQPLLVQRRAGRSPWAARP